MGCGCKNNQPQQPQTQTQQTQTTNTTKITEESVQDVIKKTIEKYYVKK
jgi:hypothetical protein